MNLLSYTDRQRVRLALFTAILSVTAMAEAPCAISANNEVQVVILQPASFEVDDIQVPAYSKLEFGIQLPNTVEEQVDEFFSSGWGLNPYMSDHILIEAFFTFPDSTVRKVHGFYYASFERDLLNEEWLKEPNMFRWRIRSGFGWNTDEAIRCDIKISIAEWEVIELDPIGFRYTSSESSGHIVRGYEGDETDRYLRHSVSEETFFPIGHHILWEPGWPEKLDPDEYTLPQSWMDSAAAYGANTMRFLWAPWSYSIEWEGLANYRLPVAWEIDQVVEKAEELDMKLIMMLGIHNETVDFQGGHERENWSHNPYHLELALEDNSEWFTDSTAIAYQKERYRYIVARWGYSSSILVWELLSEGNICFHTDTDHSIEKKETEQFNSWFDIMYDYFKEDLDATHMVSASYSQNIDESKLDNYVFEKADVTLLHWYGDKGSETNWDRYEAIEDALNDLGNKPAIFDEISNGPELDCTGADVREASWATSLNGSFGAGINYWGNPFHNQGYYTDFLPISTFFIGEDLARGGYDQYRWKDVLFDVAKADITSYNLVNESKTHALGFVENTTFNMHSDPAVNSCGIEYIEPQELEGEKFKIRGLLSSSGFDHHYYRIEFYSTTGKGGHVAEYDQSMLETTIGGKLKVQLPPTNAEHPDWAYKVYYQGTDVGFGKAKDETELVQKQARRYSIGY